MPVVFAVDGPDLVTAVDGKPKSGRELARIRHVDADPRVSLLADHYEDDWSRLWWVRVEGTAVVEHEGEDFRRGIETLRHRYRQYQDVALPGPLIRIAPQMVQGWQASAG